MTDTDYEDLLNTIQRHTRCGSAYCLKRKANDNEARCRFNFPTDHCDKTTLQFEPIHTKDKTEKYKIQIATERNDTRINNQHRLHTKDKTEKYKIQIATERNDTRINNQLRLQLQGCRANCDIQVVTDYHACVEYLAKYAAKSETRSHIL